MSSASANVRPKRTIKPTEKILNSNLGLRKPEANLKLPATLVPVASSTKADTINHKTTEEITVPSKRIKKPTEKLLNSSLKLSQGNSKTKIERTIDSALPSENRTGSATASSPKATASSITAAASSSAAAVSTSVAAVAAPASSSIEGGRPKRTIKTTEKLLNSNLSNLRQVKNTSEQNKQREAEIAGKDDGKVTKLNPIKEVVTKDKPKTTEIITDRNKKQNYGLVKNIKMNITPINELIEKNNNTKPRSEATQKRNLIVKRAVTRKMTKLDEPSNVEHGGDGKKAGNVGSSKEQTNSKKIEIEKKTNPDANLKTKESQMKSDKPMDKTDNKQTVDKDQKLPVKNRKINTTKVDQTQSPKDAETHSKTVEPVGEETNNNNNNNNILEIEEGAIESNEKINVSMISDVEDADINAQPAEQPKSIETQPLEQSNEPIEKQNIVVQKTITKMNDPLAVDDKRPPRNIKKPQRFIEQHSDVNSSSSILNIDKCSKQPDHIPIYRFIENIPSVKTKTSSKNNNMKNDNNNDIYSLTNIAADLSDGDDDPAKDIIKKLRKEKKVTVKNQIRKKPITKKKLEKPFWMNKNMPKTIVQMNIKKSNNQMIVSRPNKEIINHIINTNTDKLLNQISINNLNINDDVDNINLSFDLSSCGGSRPSVGVRTPVGQSTPKAPPLTPLASIPSKKIPAVHPLTLATKTLSNNKGDGNVVMYRNNINKNIINNSNDKNNDKVAISDPPPIKDPPGIEPVSSDNSDAENVQPDDYVSIQKELMNRSQNIIINRKRNAIPIRKPLQTLTAFNTAMAELRKPNHNGIHILRNIQISKPIQHYLNETTEISMGSAAAAPPTTITEAAEEESSDIDNHSNLSNDFQKENADCISHENALFGFEDYINNTNDVESTTTATENISLNKEKLKCLLAEQRKKNENISNTSIVDTTICSKNKLQIPAVTTGQITKNTIPKTQKIFTDLNDKQRNQHKDIREVFQEIALKQKSNTNRNSMESSSSDDDESSIRKRPAITKTPQLQVNTSATNRNTSPIIFHDLPKPEPSKPHKHYAGKRKRKLNFELNDAENENENEAPKSKKPSKAKQLQDEKFNQELNAFADEFNSMCEQVNSYDVVIEKV